MPIALDDKSKSEYGQCAALLGLESNVVAIPDMLDSDPD